MFLKIEALFYCILSTINLYTTAIVNIITDCCIAKYSINQVKILVTKEI